mmetsp:Transcript_25700/g.56317  ORF Transcript_25700/g.56317 Transcript_25700/m.56317 type:complete len:120 (+) Transcript_25700:1553-1912(+)
MPAPARTKGAESDHQLPLDPLQAPGLVQRSAADGDISQRGPAWLMMRRRAEKSIPFHMSLACNSGVLSSHERQTFARWDKLPYATQVPRPLRALEVTEVAATCSWLCTACDNHVCVVTS